MKTFLKKLSVTTVLVSLFTINAWAQVDTTLSYFNGALLAHVVGPKAPAAGKKADNTFIVEITDANGTAYPAITKQFLSATVEMTNMDMGIMTVSRIEDVLDANSQFQGKISVNPLFSMRGPWKLNLTIKASAADGSELSDTQAVTFDVNK